MGWLWETIRQIQKSRKFYHEMEEGNIENEIKII